MKMIITFGITYILLQFLSLMGDSSAAEEYNQDSEVRIESKDHHIVERQVKVNDLSRDYQARSNILKTKKVSAGPETEGPVEPNLGEQKIQKTADGPGGGTRPKVVSGGGKRKFYDDYDPAGTPNEYRKRGEDVPRIQ